MPLVVPPVVVLAVLLALLATQVAYILAPRAPHYVVRLGVSALSVLLGEAVGRAAMGDRLALGELHPATDLIFLVVLQWAASRWLRREAV